MPAPVPALVLLLLLAACAAPPLPSSAMPVVGIQTPGGHELGVSTEDGVLFLARTAKAGPAKVLYFLGPSPLIEAGRILGVGGSIHRVELEVTIPSVPISFDPVQKGEELLLLALSNEEPWSAWVRVADSPFAEGTVLEGTGLGLRGEHVGAGVFRSTSAGLSMVGLIKGVARFENGPDYLLMAGLPELRLAFVQPETAVPRQEVRYRDDGLRVYRVRR
ncbi:MAG: hypothetical protein ACE5F1_20695 [Planctomycetota bacterium]